MIISSQRCIVRGVGHPWITALCYHQQYSQQIPSQGGPPKTPSTDTPGPPPSTWRKAVNTIKSFGQGAKLLFNDIKKMRRVKRSLGGFKLSGATPMSRPSGDGITIEHIQFVYKTSADIKRTLPTMVLFCIPLLGYAAPFLALMFPGQLLSTHFWSEKQKTELIEKSIELRRAAIPELVALTSETGNKEISELIHQLNATQGSIDELPSVTNGYISLDSLSSKHIQLLSRSWGVSRAFIPINWFQTRKLRKHLHYIESCDWLLLRETDTLDKADPDLINELVRERLPLQYPSNNSNEKLKKWLNTKSLVQETEIFNEVFLAHMVVRPK